MVYLLKKKQTTISFMKLILCACALLFFSQPLHCMEEEHKEPYKPTIIKQAQTILPLHVRIQKLYKSVPQNPTSTIQSQVTEDFLLKALRRLNHVSDYEQLIYTITALLDDKTDPSHLEPRIVTLASILIAHTKLHPYVTKAHELMYRAFEKIYNTDGRSDPYGINQRNHALGASWVLEIATILINHKPVLYNISQSLYDIISFDAQNPEKLIHIIQYFFDHGFSPQTLLAFFQTHDIDIEDAHRDHSDGATPLILSCANGFDTISQFLVDAGALITTNDHAKNTALHYAVLDGHLPTIQLLCQRGAENTPNQFETQPSTMALQLSDERPTQHTATILESILPKTIIDDAALQHSFEELYFYLCTQCLTYLSPQTTVLALSYASNWFDPDIIITYAGCHGYNSIVRVLGKTDTDLNAVDDYKKTAMDYALKNGQLQTVELLTQLGVEDYSPQGVAYSSLVPELMETIGYERSLHMLWALLASSAHDQQTFDILHHQLYHLVIHMLNKHVSVATATLIMAYINPIFDMTYNPMLGTDSRFVILGPFAQNPYSIDAGIQKMLTPHDQSITLLNTIGTWLKTTAAIARQNFNADIADTDGTTAFDLALKTGSWSKARILAMAGSRPDTIKALHGLITYIKKHPTDQTVAPKKLLELISVLSEITINNIDQARHHNEFIIPLVYKFLPLLSRPQTPQSNDPALQELDNDLATTVEIQRSIPTFQGIATPLIGIIASYLIRPLAQAKGL